MTANTDEALSLPIEIRAFTSVDEILNLPNFEKDHPVTKESYDKLHGHYNFGIDFYCCFQEEGGQLCYRRHQFGYVVVLKDGTKSIIGNHCGKTKFGADHSLSRDTALYQNKKKYLESLARAEKLLEEKDQRLEALDLMRQSLMRMNTRLASFRRSIGPQTMSAIEDALKTGATVVRINGVTSREYVDEAGQQRTERSTAIITVGHLRGVQCFDRSRYNGLGSRTNRVQQAFIELEEDINKNVRQSRLSKLESEIRLSEEVIADGKRMLNQAEVFFASDLSALCYLSPDRRDRVKTAREILRLKGEDASKSKAREWISTMDAGLKESHKVDKLEIS